MKHPRNCNGCKAFFQSQYKFSCELGYELNVKKIKKFQGMDVYLVSPKCGECPKPITFAELFKATKGMTNG